VDDFTVNDEEREREFFQQQEREKRVLGVDRLFVRNDKSGRKQEPKRREL